MREKIKYISIIAIVFLMLFTIKSNAAMAIKPGTSSWTKISVSESYQQCYNLRNSDATLGKNNLDPHLTLNKDWGAVAYLAISPYGKVEKDIRGPKISINGTNYYTTTGNITGVMNMGEYYTQTSSLLGGNGNDNTTNLTNNLSTKYVENLSAETSIENTRGQAIAETWGWFSSDKYYSTSSAPVGIRHGILGLGNYGFGYYGNDYSIGMGRSSTATFRPVIWNIK